MPENTKKITKNFISVSGYLKENKLKAATNKAGQPVISGSITVSTGEFGDYKVSVYTNSKRKDNTDNEVYKGFLPFVNGTLVGKDIATLLQSNSSLNYASAASLAARVWVNGSVNEYPAKNQDDANPDDPIVNTMLRATGTGAKAACGVISADHSFTPHATFRLYGYIKAKNQEKGDDEEGTGRLELTLVVPSYNGSAVVVPVIADATKLVGKEVTCAQYMDENFEVGQMAGLSGVIAMVQHSKGAKEGAAPASQGGFSTADAYVPSQAPTVYFRKAFIITGSDTAMGTDLAPDGEVSSSYTNADIKACLAKRLTELQERVQKMQANPMQAHQNVAFATTAPAAINPGTTPVIPAAPAPVATKPFVEAPEGDEPGAEDIYDTKF
jgi:hypothetical protein